MDVGLLKRSFRITGSGMLKEIPKVFTWCLHAGIAGGRLLGSTFLTARQIERVSAVAQWLRCCATNRKVAGSIPAGVSGFFIDIILPIALWPWGRLSPWHKWVPAVFLGGKGGRFVRLTTYHHPVPLSRNLGALTSWNPLGLSGPVMGLLYLFLPLRLIENRLPQFPMKRHSRAVARSETADWGSFVIRAWWCYTTYSSLSLGILEESASGTMDLGWGVDRQHGLLLTLI